MYIHFFTFIPYCSRLQNGSLYSLDVSRRAIQKEVRIAPFDSSYKYTDLLHKSEEASSFYLCGLVL